MLQNRRFSCPCLSTKIDHLWAQKLVYRTFRTVLRTKWPKNGVKRQIEHIHFWGLKSPIFAGSELWLDVTSPILGLHQG